MAVLVIAEHDNKTLKRATLQAVDAAARLGEVHLLVLGSGVDAVAQAAAKVAGVAQVKVVDDPALAEPLAEVVTAQVVPLAKDYSHVVAAATAHGKDFMPRVAALLDVAQISEVTGIDSADTFRRPIYAGNAIATVQSSDPIKVLTVRGTSFDEAAAEGGSAAIEKVAAVAVDGQPALVGREKASSDRPELTAAQVVVAGGRGLGSAEQFQAVLEQAELAVVHFGISAQFAQIGAQKGKVVFQVNLPNRQNAFHGGFVAQMATQNVAGIGGQYQDFALFDLPGHLFDQPFLRIIGVNGK